MTIPKYKDMFTPFLETIKDGKPHKYRDIATSVADMMHISEKDRKELLPSGNVHYINRVGWASTYLKKAGLIEAPSRAVFQITTNGKKALKECPKGVTLEYLKQFDSFNEFLAQGNQPTSSENDKLLLNSENNTDTPQEQMEHNYSIINTQLADNLMSAIMDKDPWFFERLVVKLVKAMGYGNGLANEGIVTEKTGDGGIDGIITEDRLGFEKIYIQAKRFQPETVIGRPVIQQFLGALMGKGATKGLFITTAKYSKDAIEFVDNHLQAKIVLIDGDKLTKLMIEYNIGVALTNNIYTIKTIDNDFFTDEDE